MTILPDMSKPSYEQLLARIAALEAAKPVRGITCKVSEKKIDPDTGALKGGALSIYGLSARFPITLYLSQFDRLAAEWTTVCAFVEAHRSEFTIKEPRA